MATLWRFGSTFEPWRFGSKFEPASLHRNGEYLCNAEIAVNRAARRAGLRGRDFLDGALWLPRCRWIHSFGVTFEIDVAYLNLDGVVIRVERVAPRSLCLPVIAAASVVESYAGAMQTWGLKEGDRLSLMRDSQMLHGIKR